KKNTGGILGCGSCSAGQRNVPDGQFCVQVFLISRVIGQKASRLDGRTCERPEFRWRAVHVERGVCRAAAARQRRCGRRREDKDMGVYLRESTEEGHRGGPATLPSCALLLRVSSVARTPQLLPSLSVQLPRNRASIFGRSASALPRTSGSWIFLSTSTKTPQDE
ncbi:hypothetical protein ANANG_G00314640, partial [Anguilla anguilla]